LPFEPEEDRRASGIGERPEPAAPALVGKGTRQDGSEIMPRTGFRPLLAAAVAFGMTAALTAPCAAAFAANDQSPPKPAHRRTGPQLVVPGGTSGRTLSQQLSRSGGVLHPPLVGSGKAVVPPPGTPGGNPHVEPK
jgi:hypothetical protein